MKAEYEPLSRNKLSTEFKVDPSDTFVRPTGERAVRPEQFKLRGPAPEALEDLERKLVGY